MAPSSLNSFLYGPGKQSMPSEIFDEKGIIEKKVKKHISDIPIMEAKQSILEASHNFTDQLSLKESKLNKRKKSASPSTRRSFVYDHAADSLTPDKRADEKVKGEFTVPSSFR